MDGWADRLTWVDVTWVDWFWQVPMLIVSAKIEQYCKDTPFSQLGNYLFWLTFCFLGQPAAVLLYFYRPDTP
jgi:diacylglycerol O-acyltransferase 1